MAAKPPEAPSGTLLDLLSAERRREILEEALGAAARTAVAGAQTFGHLVDALTGHAHWEHLQNLPVSAVMRPAGTTVAGPTAGAPAVAAPKPAAAPTAAAAKPSAPPIPGPAQKPAPKTSSTPATSALQQQILDFVHKNPGSRAEVIRKALGGQPETITGALADLFAAGKVKRAGKARGTKYIVA